MQRLFEAHRRLAPVDHGKFQTKSGTHRYAIGHAEFVRPTLPRRRTALRNANQRHRSTLPRAKRIGPPLLRAHKPMLRRLRVIGLVPEPREAHRDSAPDRAALLPIRLLAEEQDLLGARGLPPRYLRAVQRNLRRRRDRGNTHNRQPAVARYHLRHSFNPDPFIQRGNARMSVHTEADSRRSPPTLP